VSTSPPITLLERYRDLLAREGESFPISLGEGGTPLVRARRLGAEIGVPNLHLKFEGTNPTGLPCHVILPAGKVARGKLAQALAAGARLVMVDGNFDAALAAVRRLGEEGSAVVVNSINPDRLAGQQTGAWEIVDALGRAPDALALPVGNAGNITAYWRGFRRYAEEGRTPGGELPRMLGFQAEGAAPIVRGEPVESPETVATAIRIGNPASWEGATAARDESGGLIETVTDDEILDAQRLVVQLEGVFCEPASAAGVAGVRRLSAEGRLDADLVVCVLTGHGLKDPDAVQAEEGSLTPISPDLDVIRRAMDL
jgi:threonine synthase